MINQVIITNETTGTWSKIQHITLLNLKSKTIDERLRHKILENTTVVETQLQGTRGKNSKRLTETDTPLQSNHHNNITLYQLPGN